MIKGRNWTRWVLQTAQTWEDLKFVVKETGIAHIDHEHKRMTDYMVEINKLLFQLESEFDIEIYNQQKKIMKSFYDYTAEHCHNEEVFIEKYGIKGLDIQKKEHEKLLSYMKDIIFQFETGRVTSALNHRINLLEAVVNHINDIDNDIFHFKNISERVLDLGTWSEINNFIRMIHIPIIDKQHKVLTEKIISLFDKMEDDEKKGDTFQDSILLLKDVINYSKYHFSTEEELIKKNRISGIDIQEKQHDLFIKFLKRTLVGLVMVDFKVSRELKERLLLWWIQHINIYDYTTFRKSDWMKPVLLKAEETDDVSWLIAKMGIEQIDNDHIKFLNILFDNLQIFSSSSEASMEEKILGLKSLRDYAIEHFDHEEKVMKEREVLDREQHIIEHKNIIKLLNDFSGLNESGRIDMSGAFKRKILLLWINHINDRDTGTFGVSYE